jgi:hypothetical protein
MARTMNADAHQAHRFPLRHLAIGRRQTQLTSGGASGLPVGPPLHSHTRVARPRAAIAVHQKHHVGDHQRELLRCCLALRAPHAWRRSLLFSIDHPYQRMADGVQFVESAPINDADNAKIAIKVPSGCSNGERFEDLNRCRLERAGKTSLARTGC